MAGRDLLACALADKATAAKIRSEVPAERFPSEILRRLATTAYERFDKNGEINRGDWVALLQDAAAMQVAAEIVDLDLPADTAEARAKGGLLSLGRAAPRSG